MNRWALIISLSFAALNFAAAESNFNKDRVLGLHAFVMRADSMEPTLIRGDRIVTDTLAYANSAPQRGDLVVFIANGPGKTIWVKRVIGQGGDTIVVSKAGVQLNGQLIREPYVATPSANGEETENADGTFAIPSGQYFLMGDNREHSLDSRHPGFGFINAKRILGRVIFIYWSSDHSRIGKELR